MEAGVSDNDSIELTPSFPTKLEREAAGLFRRQIPFRPKLMIFFGLILLVVLALLAYRFIFADRFGNSQIFALGIGGIAFSAYLIATFWLDSVYALRLQNEARSRAQPISFRFTPKRFVLDMTNARTEYEWSAIDEIAALRGGTAIRVGVFAYPVADNDLPEGLAPQEFRARLNGWKSAS